MKMLTLRRPTHVLSGTVVLLLSLSLPVKAGVNSRVQGMIDAADLRGAQVSLMAADASTGEVIMEMNGDRPLTPASNMKLVTTCAALRVLGPDFVFKTDLIVLDANPEAAVLLIKGDGDPGLGDPVLLSSINMDADALLGLWVKAVTDAGIRNVRQIIVDDRIFDRQWVHPDWPVEQLHKWYCAQVGGVTFNDNCLDLFPAPTRMGQAPIVSMRPSANFIQVVNRAVTGDANTFWADRRPEENIFTYRGKIKTKRVEAINVTIHDPPMFFGMLVADRLTGAGVRVQGVVRPADDARLPDGKVLHRIQTPLTTVIARCNKDSQNLFAECLIKRMGFAVTGAPGSWQNGAAAERMFLHERMGARGASITVADGSGMSRNNRISARHMVDLLSSMHRDPRLGRPLRDSLSVGGEDGTLQLRFRHDLAGRVYGKSGYISQVSALSGYLVYEPEPGSAQTTPSRTIAFSLLFNGFKAPVYLQQVKELQNHIINLLDSVVASSEAPQLGG